MPKLKVTRSIEAKVSPETAFNALTNLNTWQYWSPWFILEPEAKVKVRDDARFYQWKGKRIGNGNMEVTSQKEFERVDYKLSFSKPWKSTARASITLFPSAEGTKITWSLESSMSFLLFWVKPVLENLMEVDFERGLHLLKDYLEDGELHSKLEFVGLQKFESCKFIGLKTKCIIPEIGVAMADDFSKLAKAAEPFKDILVGAPFAIYHKFDLAKKVVEYTVALPVKDSPKEIPEGYMFESMPNIDTYTITHTGPYHHLGNAWSAQMNLSRNKVYKQDKHLAPFEVYVSDPTTTEPNELITEVHFPIMMN